MKTFSRFLQGRVAAGVVLALALGGCTDNDDASPNSGAAGNGGTSSGVGGAMSSGGVSAGSAGAQSGNGKAPDGFMVTSGVDLSGEPTKCTGYPDVECSGRCPTDKQEINNCQAVAAARIFSEVARDASGNFISEQRSSSSALWSIDAATGTLMPLAQPPGDNVHLRMALDEQLLYFISDRTLFSVPRAGGEPSQLLPELPNTEQFAVLGGRLFAQISLDPELHEIDLAQGTSVVHDRDATSLLRDGNDLYFAEGGSLYLAVGANIAGATNIASPVTTILGFVGDSLYAIGGADAERTVRRFPKAGGTGEVVVTLGAKGVAALANDAVAFSRPDGTKHYVCTVGLDGKSPTVHGYLSSQPALLAADAGHVYATFGFNMVRMKR